MARVDGWQARPGQLTFRVVPRLLRIFIRRVRVSVASPLAARAALRANPDVHRCSGCLVNGALPRPPRRARLDRRD
jgi:hypothetical protein